MQPIYSKLLLAFIFYLGTSYHPLHVSTTEISFNAKEKSLEISCSLFTDDFEKVLAQNYQTKTDLSKPEFHKAMDVLIKRYVSSNLKYTVNGKSINATYIGFEIDHEATNVYLEIDNITALERLALKNTLLYDLFDDQMNILHVERGGVRKSARTNYPSTLLSVAF